MQSVATSIRKHPDAWHRSQLPGTGSQWLVQWALQHLLGRLPSIRYSKQGNYSPNLLAALDYLWGSGGNGESLRTGASRYGRDGFVDAATAASDEGTSAIRFHRRDL